MVGEIMLFECRADNKIHNSQLQSGVATCLSSLLPHAFGKRLLAWMGRTKAGFKMNSYMDTNLKRKLDFF